MFEHSKKGAKMNVTHFGAGSPSASHSMMNGLSVSPNDATWNSISSAMGCLIIRGGEWTGRMSWTCLLLLFETIRLEIEFQFFWTVLRKKHEQQLLTKRVWCQR